MGANEIYLAVGGPMGRSLGEGGWAGPGLLGQVLSEVLGAYKRPYKRSLMTFGGSGHVVRQSRVSWSALVSSLMNNE